MGETVRPRFPDASFWAQPRDVSSAYVSGNVEARLQDDQRVIDTTDNLVFVPDEATVAPGIPDSAGVVGIVTLAAMVSVIALARSFPKYGDDYEAE